MDQSAKVAWEAAAGAVHAEVAASGTVMRVMGAAVAAWKVAKTAEQVVGALVAVDQMEVRPAAMEGSAMKAAVLWQLIQQAYCYHSGGRRLNRW